MLKKKSDNPAERDKKKIEEEIVFEEDISIASGQETLKKLREKLKKCVSEKQEYLEGWQRAKADFVNFRKEQEKSRKNLTDFIKQDLLLEFIALADNFEMAFANKEAWEKIDKGWRQGVEHIYGQLMGILEEHGVNSIEAVNKKFNPQEHHSIGTIDVEKKRKR